jgi:hypothetical protein
LDFKPWFLIVNISLKLILSSSIEVDVERFLVKIFKFASSFNEIFKLKKFCFTGYFEVNIQTHNENFLLKI